MGYTFLELRGKEINPYIQEIANLRINVFKEYPYLYEGSFAYEEKYLQTYINSPRSLFILVKDKSKYIAASSCIPLLDEETKLQKPFLENNFELKKIFYLGESIVLKDYRGRGIGKSFFEKRHKHALKTTKDLQITTFCSVVRDKSYDNKKAESYRANDSLWTKVGYERQDKLIAEYKWPDIGENKESIKKMIFWTRQVPENTEG